MRSLKPLLGVWGRSSKGLCALASNTDISGLRSQHGRNCPIPAPQALALCRHARQAPRRPGQKPLDALHSFGRPGEAPAEDTVRPPTPQLEARAGTRAPNAAASPTRLRGGAGQGRASGPERALGPAGVPGAAQRTRLCPPLPRHPARPGSLHRCAELCASEGSLRSPCGKNGPRPRPGVRAPNLQPRQGSRVTGNATIGQEAGEWGPGRPAEPPSASGLPAWAHTQGTLRPTDPPAGLMGTGS